jgi:signal peptidase II
MVQKRVAARPATQAAPVQSAGARATMIWLEPALAAVAVLAADQASKALVLRIPPHALRRGRPLVGIRRWLNRRGLLAALSAPMLLAIWAATLGLVAIVLCGDAFHRSMLGAVGFGTAVGGATGNLLDRLRQGAIVDFIAIGWWPAFNLADVAIVSGVGLALLSML